MQWYEADGTPIRGGCKKQPNCSFLHPEEPDWASAEPDRGPQPFRRQSDTFASNANATPLSPVAGSGSGTWGHGGGGSGATSSNAVGSPSAGAWGQWGTAKDASSNTIDNASSSGWVGSGWTSTANDMGSGGGGIPDSTSTGEDTGGGTWGSGATWGATADDTTGWGSTWGATNTGNAWGNAAGQAASPSTTAVNTGDGRGSSINQATEPPTTTASTWCTTDTAMPDAGTSGWGRTFDQPKSPDTTRETKSSTPIEGPKATNTDGHSRASSISNAVTLRPSVHEPLSATADSSKQDPEEDLGNKPFAERLVRYAQCCCAKTWMLKYSSQDDKHQCYSPRTTR